MSGRLDLLLLTMFMMNIHIKNVKFSVLISSYRLLGSMVRVDGHRLSQICEDKIN